MEESLRTWLPQDLTMSSWCQDLVSSHPPTATKISRSSRYVVNYISCDADVSWVSKFKCGILSTLLILLLFGHVKKVMRLLQTYQCQNLWTQPFLITDGEIPSCSQNQWCSWPSYVPSGTQQQMAEWVHLTFSGLPEKWSALRQKLRFPRYSGQFDQHRVSAVLDQ